ncbi:MAG TPA: hypothetical protein VGP72_17920 [Planctomycetota bacterium]
MSDSTAAPSFWSDLREFIRKPSVVRVVSIACCVAAGPFIVMALFWCLRGKSLWMWCNVFWALVLIAAGFVIPRIGIQRFFALVLLLVSLIFLGTCAVWTQLNDPLFAVANAFWFIVFIAAAYIVNPRRDRTGNALTDEVGATGNSNDKRA